MVIWQESLLQIHALRDERKVCDLRLYDIQIRLQKEKSTQEKLRKQETVLPTDYEGISKLKKDIAEQENQFQQLGLKLNALNDLQENVLTSENRLGFIDLQLQSLDTQNLELKLALSEVQHQQPLDQKAVEKLQLLLKQLADTQKNLQQEQKKTSKSLSASRQQLKKADVHKIEIEVERTRIQEQISSLTQKLTAVLRPSQQEQQQALAASKKLIVTLEGQYQEAKKQLQASRAAVEQAIAELYPHFDVPPRDLVPKLTDDIPFLLMPVRIETRFMSIDNKQELWLRIYPDDIAIHTHENIITDREVAEGEKYWRTLWNAATEDEKKSAWSYLVDKFGSQRAAWVARQTQATNWNSRDEDIAPVFPEHDLTKTSSWSRAPRTTVLPDKFVVMLYEGDTVVKEVTGKPIPDELIVGPDPLEVEDAFINKDDKLLFGKEFDWSSDFAKAQELGMAFNIPITEHQAVNGFSKILVLGLSLSSNASDSKDALESLIDNHHYSPKGFSLVRQGTATNNTDEGKSGFTKNDQFNAISYYAETGDPLFTEEDDMDGRDLANALGIDYEPLQYVFNSDATDRREAIAMNTALYSGTLGYYFDTLMQPVLSETAQETLREFFIQRVTGRGPLSSIRVGNQPYGILLTSDFGKWQWSRQENALRSHFLQTLYQTLQKYHAIWLGLLDKVNYVGKPGGQDTSEILMDILGLQASSVSFNQRIGYSTDYLRNLDNFQYGGRYFNDLSQNFNSKNNTLNFLSSLGYAEKDAQGILKVPQLLRLLYQHYHTPLDAKNIIDNIPLSEKDSIRYYDEAAKKNYLDWLAEVQSIATLEQQDFGSGRQAPNTLLYLNLRRALLLQLHKASVKWFLRNNVDVTATLNATNFYNIRPQIDLTKWETMKAKVAVAVPLHPDNNKTVSDYLLTTGKNQSEADFLNSVRDALKTLAPLPTASLERCFTEHIDTCTYRLDSWQSAMFSVRLENQRQRTVEGNRGGRKKGIYLGAYGWVENLHPSTKPQVVREGIPEKLMPKNGVPLFEYANNGGFVHAPSLNQASAAAVLRSGYLSDARTSHPDSLSVNLSSERIRRALFILQGIRNGQTLEALLGYQFERGLHDAASSDITLIRLNEYIYDFREKFPLQQHHLKQQGSDTPVETIPPNNVVNGVTLAEAIGDVPYSAIGAVTAATDSEKTAIRKQKDQLADSLDAVKDLLQSESVYQMVQGNFDRASAVINALQDANIPPEIDIINTPRSSHFTFTHRVALQFDILDANDPANNPWHPVPMSIRASIELGLNAWLGKVLEPANTLFCKVARLDQDGNALDTEEVSIDKLAIQPIDLVYLIGDQLNTGTPQADKENKTAASELEMRIAWYYRTLKGLDDNSTVHIEFLQPNGKRTLGKLLPLLRMLKGLVTDARPLHAQDFDPPSKLSMADKNNPQGYLFDDLFNRIQGFQIAFSTLLSDINTLSIDAIVPDKDGNALHYFSLQSAFEVLQIAHLQFADITFVFSDSDALLLQKKLLAVADTGLPDAFPQQRLLLDNSHKAILLHQAMNVARKMSLIVENANILLNEANIATDSSKKIQLCISASKALMGDMFKILPHFTYNNEPDIQLSHAAREQLLKYAKDEVKMPYPAEEWMQNVAHVRPNIARLDTVLSLYEWSTGDRLSLLPIQLPYRDNDSWLAVEFPKVNPLHPDQPFNIEHDTLSVTIHGDAAFNPASAQCGLLIDDWVEVIPTNNETTGIAFNYDQPNVVPPQALLLAVTPQEKGHWSWDEIVGILNDTLQRAKLRAVEPQLLDTLDKAEIGVLLPAILADFSQYDLNVALDYRMNIHYVYQTAPIKMAKLP